MIVRVVAACMIPLSRFSFGVRRLRWRVATLVPKSAYAVDAVDSEVIRKDKWLFREVGRIGGNTPRLQSPWPLASPPNPECFQAKSKVPLNSARVNQYGSTGFKLFSKLPEPDVVLVTDLRERICWLPSRCQTTTQNSSARVQKTVELGPNQLSAVRQVVSEVIAD
jgi:hypothetical protein